MILAAWQSHISYIKTKISKSLGVIYRAKKFIRKKLYSIYIIPMYFLITCIV